MQQRSKLLLLVGCVAFSILMLEILLTRLFTFFLGGISSFVAIPVTMFGLAIGALAIQLSRRLQAIPLHRLVAGLPVVTALAFLSLFYLFNHHFNLTWHYHQTPQQDAVKTTIFSLLFVPPIAIGGIVLATVFREHAEELPRLYASDLLCSSLACILTPLCLRFLPLPLVIVAVIASQTLGFVASLGHEQKRARWIALLAFGALVILAGLKVLFVEVPNAHAIAQLARLQTGSGHRVEAKELASRWDQISRVSLIETIHHASSGPTRDYSLIHDDGVSNVFISPFVPARVQASFPTAKNRWSLPFLMLPTAKRALVMFAGAGRDMLHMYEHAKGNLEVTGVELNPLVPKLAVADGDRWNLAAFYRLPGVHLVIDEGRAFLDRTDQRYDIIYVSANGSQYSTRTGHSRKFLETYEAMAAYLDHLHPDGVLIFAEQPQVHRIEMFKRLFAERGIGPLTERMMLLAQAKEDPIQHYLSVLVIRPRGFSPQEIAKVRQFWLSTPGRVVAYAPDLPGSLQAEVSRPIDASRFVPTDDRPYTFPVDFAGFFSTTDQKTQRDLLFWLSWIKVFTLALFIVLSVLVGAAFYLRRETRSSPPILLGYFLATGVAYMLAQIGLMAKLELFVGRPMYAVAVVLAGFLLANGLGSAWVARRNRIRPVPILIPAFGATVSLPLTMLAIEHGLFQLLQVSIGVKCALALATLFPFAFFIGMFYPIGVRIFTDRGHRAAVPMTFGWATLSSVLGSTYAIVIVINVGFRHVLWQGEAIYLALTLLSLGILIRENATRF